MVMEPIEHDQPETFWRKAPGAKDDADKPRVGLMLHDFARALEAVAAVTTMGVRKYSAGSWVYVRDGVARYTDALARHLLAEEREDRDPESGLLHAAHAAWNALARLDLMLRKEEGWRPPVPVEAAPPVRVGMCTGCGSTVGQQHTPDCGNRGRDARRFQKGDRVVLISGKTMRASSDGSLKRVEFFYASPKGKVWTVLRREAGNANPADDTVPGMKDRGALLIDGSDWVLFDDEVREAL